MTYEEYLQGTDDLEEEAGQLEEDINNVQSAIYRLQEVVNDSSEAIIKETMKELEWYIKVLEFKKEEAEHELIRINRHLPEITRLD